MHFFPQEAESLSWHTYLLVLVPVYLVPSIISPRSVPKYVCTLHRIEFEARARLECGAIGEPASIAQGGEEEIGWEWEAEEISAFALQIHAKMRQQLEQEAAFVEIGFKSGIALMTGALAIEDDTKVRPRTVCFSAASYIPCLCSNSAHTRPLQTIWDRQICPVQNLMF